MTPTGQAPQDELAAIRCEVERMYATRGRANFTDAELVLYEQLLEREKVLLAASQGRLDA